MIRRKIAITREVTIEDNFANRDGSPPQSLVHLVHLPDVPHPPGTQTGQEGQVVMVHCVHPPVAL